MKVLKSTVVALALVAGLSTSVSASENQQVKPKGVNLQHDTSTKELRMHYRLDRLMRETYTEPFRVHSTTDVTFTLLQWRWDGKEGIPWVTYKLMDIKGEISVREVYGVIGNEGDLKITFPNLPPGHYYILIKNNSGFAVDGYGFVQY